MLTLLALASPLAAKPLRGAAKYPRVDVNVVPRPRPALAGDRTKAPPNSVGEKEPAIDLSKAMPAGGLARMPSSAQQLGSLNAELAKDRPALASAKQQSDSLAAQARALRQQLIDTAARIEELERAKIDLGGQIASLESQDAALTESFARDRVSVTRLLAILERLQHDMPPALAVRPDDALAAARGAMLVGGTLPPVYQKASELAHRIGRLKATRLALVTRRAESVKNADALSGARVKLQALSAQKEREAAGAADLYGGLKLRLADIAAKAADLQSLVTRVGQLRRAAPDAGEQGIVTVTASNKDALGPLSKGSLLQPVVGTMVPALSGAETSKNPGLTYTTRGGAQVIAPADGKVLFAGPYHRTGQVLILEITTGYDLVLAGLGQVNVRPNDELLAGEPVGTMPNNGADDKSESLYFELRRNGHGLDPTPWLSLELRKAKKT